ncbi:MAG TPA: transglycosylase SLT domain-containing protein [Xanthobacteraceae bacterium]|nr:transglycosylase SLT domain-containing protein [Xanthobacteraceae bacterium]
MRIRCFIPILGLSLALGAGPGIAGGSDTAEKPATTSAMVDDEPAEQGWTTTMAVVAQPPRPIDLPPPSVFTPQRTARPITTGGSAPHGDGASYRAIVEREAAALGIPPELVDAIMAVESSYNPNTQGVDGEVGLMQVMPSTAALLGFTGSPAELAVPETNIHYGVMYLAAAWRLAGQDICTTTMKYRAGHGETRFSFRSVDYCTRVRAHLAAHGYPVTGIVPTPTFGQPSVAGGRARLQLARGPGAINLDALNTQLREMTDRIATPVFH